MSTIARPTPTSAAAIASFKWTVDNGIEYKFWDKNSALERAAKILGLFKEDNKQRETTLVSRIELVPLRADDDSAD